MDPQQRMLLEVVHEALDSGTFDLITMVVFIACINLTSLTSTTCSWDSSRLIVQHSHQRLLRLFRAR